jgi:hypothetical protein
MYSYEEIRDELEIVVRKQKQLNIGEFRIIRNESTQIIGSFNPGDRSLYLYEQAVIQNAQKNGWDIIETFYIALAHELGHAHDPDLESKRLQSQILLNKYTEKINKGIEKRVLTNADWDQLTELIIPYNQLINDMEIYAWQNGRQFVDKALHELYEEDNVQNLRNYQKHKERYDRADKVITALQRDPKITLVEAKQELAQYLKWIEERRGW